MMNSKSYVNNNSVVPSHSLSMTSLINTSGIAQPLKKIASNFDILYNRRSYVHWFIGEGLSKGGKKLKKYFTLNLMFQQNMVRTAIFLLM